MRRILGLLVFMLPVIAAAQSGIEGTWRIDLDKAQMDAKPTVYELNNGMFTCATCDPKIHIKADGQDQKVSGDPYLDTERVTVVNDNTVEREGMKNGKLVFRSKLTISPDGKTLTNQYEGHPAGGSQEVTGTETLSRLGMPEARGHALSGSWKREKWESVSDNALTFSYNLTGDGITYKSSTGESYNARFDGKDYPFHGDPGTTAVVVKKIDDHTFEETYKRNGEVVGTSQMTIAPDGKALTIVSESTRLGRTDRWTAEKQVNTEASK